ncbi:MAG TPA: type 4a pilus biogenesis protein PilO [Thermoanaerobaculia bacterium]
MSAPAVPAAGVRVLGVLRSALDRVTRRGFRASAWRARAPLIAGLALVLAAGIFVLVTYHGFYDARVQALEATRVELAARRDEAAVAAAKVKATEQRLRNIQKELETFNKDVLGTRKERLAALIEDVYALTQKSGLVPGQIAYALGDSAGAARLGLTFSVQGRYADVKRLLFSFENNPRFLLLENVAVSTDDREPDILRLNLVVAHYFRPDAASPRRAARAVAGRAPAAPVKAAPNPGVPE